VIAHWDEAAGRHAEAGHIAGEWTYLGAAAGTKTVGLNRIKIDPGKWSTPFHRHTAEEEIFFVLSGTGVCLLDGSAFAVGPGDCVVHRMRELHALRADDDGLDVLAFGTRGRTEVGHLPRAGVGWIGGTWTDVGGSHPWEREAEAGEPEIPEVGVRPGSVINVEDVDGGDNPAGDWRLLARNAGAELTGLNWGHLYAGEEGAAPHCHSADEELFVVLEGSGALELWPSPQHVRDGRELETVEIRAGHVISRPPSTGISHTFRAGEDGLVFLAYGTRNANDVCYYPRSNKIFFRGLGLVARLEDLPYDDDDEPG
jgi:uncharacterized cupin superfamily protein